ncbi:MAG: nicotinate (nicotinamide) nucleotide adenylyltransferase [Bacteroidales bacterium]|nr:nicotinate (nicotinamide) nucleotide adenylyltransferase [Bacteroidales bacterium]
MSHVGLYFGSFNPVHDGHLVIAEYMLEHACIDELWFVLSPQNPLKNPNDLWSNEKRFELLKSAIDGKSKMSICTVEWDMPKPSFTIDTLEKLSQLNPDATFSIIMGSDNLEKIEQWKSFETILSTYKVFVYPRPNTVRNQYFQHPNVTVFNAPPLNISSTQIRSATPNEI